AGRVGLLVPTRARQPVANELLVISLRCNADAVGRPVPVARAVWSEDLVDEDDILTDDTELEFGVGEDEAAPGGKLRGVLVQLQAGVAKLRRQLVAELLFHMVECDVLFVPNFRFIRRRNGGLCELFSMDTVT